jgi:hypothetical protein
VRQLDARQLAELGERWRASRPFPHLVLDELLEPSELQELRAAFAQEPHYPTAGEIYELLSSSDPPQHAALRAFLRELISGPLGALMSELTGKQLAHVEGRGYVYLPGHYLLPHSDCREGLRREVAYAYYLSPGEVRGGALQLYDVRLEGGEVVATEPALRIEPRANRLVVFEVSPRSLHEVGEVLEGARASLAGWLLS